MNKFFKNAKDKIKGKTLRGDDFMIKKIAWDTFKNTGDINTFLELKQIEQIENEMKQTNNFSINNLQNNYNNDKIVKNEDINRF